MRKSHWLILALVLLSFGIGIYFYPQLPDKVASHWNIQGEPDRYTSKFWGAFLMPFVSLGLFLLFILIPKIDPLKANIKKFRKYFDTFIILLFLFLLYIYLLTIFWNLGQSFNIGKMMAPALSIIFYYCGVLTEKAKRNWFIGIKTPWTLSSDKVWKKTHKVGGKLFKIAGLIAFLSIISLEYTALFLIVPILLASAYTITYSYYCYKKELSGNSKTLTK